jgi:hypothetical protein
MLRFISKSAYGISTFPVRLERNFLFQTMVNIYQSTRRYIQEKTTPIFTNRTVQEEWYNLGRYAVWLL